jgi:DNA-binding transcriptional MerR regulator/methylmalonyl-CoA mutase cobalamin-binding subunit
MTESFHAIKIVAKRTGLSAHVIRIWEKRYGAVEPDRTGTNRRLYSDDQVERLSLLREVTQKGHSIGRVATLPTEKLRELSRQSDGSGLHPADTRNGGATASALLDESIEAMKSLDSHALDETLKRGAIALGAHGLLQRVVAPLAQAIGELWRDGIITAAHEHLATAVLRSFLGHVAKPFAGTDNAPVLVVTTPAGQLHELGAMLVGSAAANLGWRVTYLGASLPAPEIVGAVRQKRARAVALSIVYPEDDPMLAGELTQLRESLSPEVAILVGGRAMIAYQDVLQKIGAMQVMDLTDLCKKLDHLRKPTKRSMS